MRRILIPVLMLGLLNTANAVGPGTSFWGEWKLARTNIVINAATALILLNPYSFFPTSILIEPNGKKVRIVETDEKSGVSEVHSGVFYPKEFVIAVDPETERDPMVIWTLSPTGYLVAQPGCNLFYSVSK